MLLLSLSVASYLHHTLPLWLGNPLWVGWFLSLFTSLFQRLGCVVSLSLDSFLSFSLWRLCLIVCLCPFPSHWGSPWSRVFFHWSLGFWVGWVGSHWVFPIFASGCLPSTFSICFFRRLIPHRGPHLSVLSTAGYVLLCVCVFFVVAFFLVCPLSFLCVFFCFLLWSCLCIWLSVERWTWFCVGVGSLGFLGLVLTLLFLFDFAKGW